MLSLAIRRIVSWYNSSYGNVSPHEDKIIYIEDWYWETQTVGHIWPKIGGCFNDNDGYKNRNIIRRIIETDINQSMHCCNCSVGKNLLHELVHHSTNERIFNIDQSEVNKYLVVIKYLLEMGASIYNVSELMDCNVLATACRSRCARELFEIMYHHDNAIFNVIVDNNGNNLAQCYVYYHQLRFCTINPDTLAYILEHTCVSDWVNYHRQNIAHCIVELCDDKKNDTTRYVEKIIEYGYINKCTDNGMTPLMWIIRNYNNDNSVYAWQCIKLLLENIADASVKCYLEKNCVDYVIQNEFFDDQERAYFIHLLMSPNRWTPERHHQIIRKCERAAILIVMIMYHANEDLIGLIPKELWYHIFDYLFVV